MAIRKEAERNHESLFPSHKSKFNSHVGADCPLPCAL